MTTQPGFCSRIFTRFVSVFTAFSFLLSSIFIPGTAQAQFITNPMIQLPSAGSLVVSSQSFVPVIIKGLTVDPQNPFVFDFILDTGDTGLGADTLQSEAQKLVKYFLASLSVSEKDMWVNLSPIEPDRIIAEGFGKTEMGRDLLAQDYLLKQLTASLLSPESEAGRKVWENIYAKAQAQYGTTDIPLDTFNKVWIVPADAVIYETGTSAFVVEGKLKVMLEEDYLATSDERLADSKGQTTANPYSLTANRSDVQDMMRNIVLPEIEREVNEGETFANLRQIYNAMLLATWYKVSLKNSLLGQVYVDQSKLKGIALASLDARDQIYNQYVETFEKGVYNAITEDYDPVTQQAVVRKYFVGGAVTYNKAQLVVKRLPELALNQLAHLGSLAGSGVKASATLIPADEISDKAMLVGNPDQVILSPIIDGKKYEGDVGSGKILNPRSRALIAHLTEKFASKIDELLTERVKRLIRIEKGYQELGFLPEDQVLEDAYGNQMTVKDIRESDWKVGAVPERLDKSGAILTGPWTLFMAISALSGKDVTDQELNLYVSVIDELLPTLSDDDQDVLEKVKEQLIEANRTGKKFVPVRIFKDGEDAVDSTADGKLAGAQIFANIVNGHMTQAVNEKKRKTYTVPNKDEWPTLTIRVPGLHLDDVDISYNNNQAKEFLAGLVFAVEPNYEQLLNNPNQGIDIVMPKLESAAELKVVINAMQEVQEHLGLRNPFNIILMNETEEATLQLEEMMWVGRHHVKLSNVGRWDYGATRMRSRWFAKKQIYPDLDSVGMKSPTMDAYVRRNVAISLKRGVKPEGGMVTAMASEGNKDPQADRNAIKSLILDKLYERKLGYDYGWVASPTYVPLVQLIFQQSRKEKVEVAEVRYDDQALENLVSLPEGEITEEGIYSNMYEYMTYTLGYRKSGAAVAIDNLPDGGRKMYDLATDKKAQYWKWIMNEVQPVVKGRVVNFDYLKEVLERVNVNTADRYHQFFTDDEIAIARMVILKLTSSKHLVLHESLPMNVIKGITDPEKAEQMFDQWLEQYNAWMDNLYDLVDREAANNAMMAGEAISFSPGPAMISKSVWDAKRALIGNYKGKGLDLSETSFLGPDYQALHTETKNKLRSLLSIPENFEIFFLPRPATDSYAMVARNLLPLKGKAAYISSGVWSENAIAAAKEIAKGAKGYTEDDIQVIASTKDQAFAYLPKLTADMFRPDASYVHMTWNNTVYGTEWKSLPDTNGIPLVLDATSNILSVKILPEDWKKIGVIYAGAQKNIGLPGFSVAIVRQDLMESPMDGTPRAERYSNWKNTEFFVTPPTDDVLTLSLVLDEFKERGGVDVLEQEADEKSGMLYEVIDQSDGFYQGLVTNVADRSRMNVSFRLADENLTEKFHSEAAEVGLLDLKGFPEEKGGPKGKTLRASIYNGMPIKGVARLVDFMAAFQEKYATDNAMMADALQSTIEGAPLPRALTPEEQKRADVIRTDWETNPRWKGIKRKYSPEHVVLLQPQLAEGVYFEESTLARVGSEKFWKMTVEEDRMVPALGAINGLQAYVYQGAGLKAIYGSGWQIAAGNNVNADMYPDTSTHSSASQAQYVREVNNFLYSGQRINNLQASTTEGIVPVVIDIDAGFGDDKKVFRTAMEVIKAGASVIHIETQDPMIKACGHLGNKMQRPTDSFIQAVQAVRLAADILGVPVVIIGRTDAEEAKLIRGEADVDELDRQWLVGVSDTGEQLTYREAEERGLVSIWDPSAKGINRILKTAGIEEGYWVPFRTKEGYYRLMKDGQKTNLNYAIEQALEYAPYVDFVWAETKTPDLEESAHFARGIHAKFPGKPLAYNLSPSFNWEEKFRDDKESIKNFIKTLEKQGYRFSFVTLAGFHALIYQSFMLGKNFGEKGMPGYVEFQNKEFEAQKEYGFPGVKHQSFVGGNVWDFLQQTFSAGLSSLSMMKGSTEEAQFKENKAMLGAVPVVSLVFLLQYVDMLQPVENIDNALMSKKTTEVGSVTPEEEEVAEAASGSMADPGYGGIDLSGTDAAMMIRRDGSGIPLPAGEQPVFNMNIQGLDLLNITITPMSTQSYHMLLGLVDTDDTEQKNADGIFREKLQAREAEELSMLN